jgi:prevent-host-death family protein
VKSLHISEDILAIGEVKAQLSRVLRQLHETQRPIVVTQNGRPAAVLITPDEFDRLRELDQFLDAVYEGLADSEAVRMIDDAALTAELDAALDSPVQS